MAKKQRYYRNPIIPADESGKWNYVAQELDKIQFYSHSVSTDIGDEGDSVPGVDPVPDPGHEHWHDNLLNIGPNDHHNQVHLLYGSDHSDVDTTTVATQGGFLVYDSAKWKDSQDFIQLTTTSLDLYGRDYKIDGETLNKWSSKIPGTFYVIGDSLTAPMGGDGGAVTYDTDGAGTITNITVTNAGTGYDKDFWLAARDANGEGALFSATVSAGGIASVSLVRQTGAFTVSLTGVAIAGVDNNDVASWAYLIDQQQEINAWDVTIDALNGRSVARTGTSYPYNAPTGAVGDVAIVMLGSNDAGGIDVGGGLAVGGGAADITQAQYETALTTLVNNLQTDNYHVVLVMPPIPDLNQFDSDWDIAFALVRESQRTVAAAEGCELWDVNTVILADFLHPSQEGHYVLARDIYPRLLGTGAANAASQWGLSGSNIYNLNAANVGVGTGTSGFPGKLTVEDSSSLAYFPPAGAVQLFVDNSGVIGNDATVVIASGDAGDSIIEFGDSSAQRAGAINYDHQNATMRFEVAGHEFLNLVDSQGVRMGYDAESLSVPAGFQGIMQANWGTTVGMYVNVNHSGATGAFNAGLSTNASDVAIMRVRNGNPGGYISFETEGNTEIMRLTADDNMCYYVTSEMYSGVSGFQCGRNLSMAPANSFTTTESARLYFGDDDDGLGNDWIAYLNVDPSGHFRVVTRPTYGRHIYLNAGGNNSFAIDGSNGKVGIGASAVTKRDSELHVTGSSYPGVILEDTGNLGPGYELRGSAGSSDKWNYQYLIGSSRVEWKYNGTTNMWLTNGGTLELPQYAGTGTRNLSVDASGTVVIGAGSSSAYWGGIASNFIKNTNTGGVALGATPAVYTRALAVSFASSGSVLPRMYIDDTVGVTGTSGAALYETYNQGVRTSLAGYATANYLIETTAGTSNSDIVFKHNSVEAMRVGYSSTTTKNWLAIGRSTNTSHSTLITDNAGDSAAAEFIRGSSTIGNAVVVVRSDVTAADTLVNRINADGSMVFGPNAPNITDNNSSTSNIHGMGATTLMSYGIDTNMQTGLFNNIYLSSASWKYKRNGAAIGFRQISFSGTAYMDWFTAPSGTAGAAATVSTVMRVNEAGELGLGTTAPLYGFHIHGHQGLFEGNATHGVVRVSRDTTNPVISTELGRFVFHSLNSTGTVARNVARIRCMTTENHTDSAAGGAMYFATAANGAGAVTDHVVLRETGEFITGGLTDNGAYNLQCNGTGVWGQGAYVNGSDYRWKSDVSDIEFGLEEIMAMRPVTFRYNELSGNKDRRLHAGFIAQEAENDLPIEGLVETGPAGYKSMAYQEVIPVLVKAIQELKAEIEELKNA